MRNENAKMRNKRRWAVGRGILYAPHTNVYSYGFMPEQSERNGQK